MEHGDVAMDSPPSFSAKLPAPILKKAAIFTRKDAAAAKKVKDVQLPLLSKTTPVFRPYKYKVRGNNT
jgi:hypothetical protein